jgi:AraC-like DNA-binding protein
MVRCYALLVQELVLSPRLGLRAHNGGLFVSPGHGTHPDRVLDSYELIFVRQGTLSLWEQDRRFDVQAGQTLLLWPGRRHYGAAPYPKSLSFYWLHFQAPGRPKTSGLSVPQHARVARVDRLTELFHRFLDDQEAGRLDTLDAALLLLLMLREVARGPAADGGQETVLVGRAEAYVSSHLTDPLSTGRIARALRVNPDYLNRAFRRARQMTLTEHIHRRRLHDAEALLREGTESILEVATACGFASVGHFRRVFERHHGLSPTAYRRLYVRTHVNIR